MYLDPSALFRQIGTSAVRSALPPYIRLGWHRLIVEKLYLKGTKKGPKLIGDFRVDASQGSQGEPPHDPGSKVSVSFNLAANEDWKMENEQGRIKSLICAILGVPETTDVTAQTGAACDPNANALCGYIVVCEGASRLAPTKPGKPGFALVNWHADQAPGANDPQAVAQRRAMIIDSMRFAPAQQPAQQPAPAQAPAPQWGQPQQFAPQGPPAQAPQWGQQPAQAPAPQWGAQPAPAAPAQPWGQPQAPAPQWGQAPAQAPQGPPAQAPQWGALPPQAPPQVAGPPQGSPQQPGQPWGGNPFGGQGR